VQVDETFVDLELIAVPSLGTFSAWCFSSGDLQDLGGETDRSFDAELPAFGSIDQIASDYTN
jgi:hypothetical protein